MFWFEQKYNPIGDKKSNDKNLLLKMSIQLINDETKLSIISYRLRISFSILDIKGRHDILYSSVINSIDHYQNKTDQKNRLTMDFYILLTNGAWLLYKWPVGRGFSVLERYLLNKYFPNFNSIFNVELYTICFSDYKVIENFIKKSYTVKKKCA